MNSYAPMSQLDSELSMRETPRWSVFGQRPELVGMASMAGLDGCSAMVCVGPPLAAGRSSPGEPSMVGSSLNVASQLAAVVRQVVPQIRNRASVIRTSFDCSRRRGSVSGIVLLPPRPDVSVNRTVFDT